MIETDTVDDGRLPIGILAYRRPSHLRRALDAIESAEGFRDCLIRIFIDGPRTSAAASEVDECIHVAEKFRRRHIKAGPEIEIASRSDNRGLSGSVIAATTELCREYGHAVILEDDLLVAKNFLSYMSAALGRFKHDKKVLQIAGHSHDRVVGPASFVRLGTSWGWATWNDRWEAFLLTRESDEIGRFGSQLSTRRFNFRNSYPYDILFQLQQAGKIDSWAIQFHLFMLMQDGCALFPPSSLVQNEGLDGSGEHCGRVTRNGHRSVLVEFELPEKVRVDFARELSIRKALRGRFGLNYVRHRIAMKWRSWAKQ